MQEIWLYGAGDMGRKIFKILCDFEIEVSGFIESDVLVENKSLADKPIISYKKYEQLYKNRVYIIITPANEPVKEEIRNKLLRNGTCRENIITKEYVIRKYWKIHNNLNRKFPKNDYRTWIIDTGEWGSFGGVEKYTYNLTRLLREKGEKVSFIFPSKLDLVPNDLKELAISYNFFTRNEDEVESFVHLSNVKEYMDIDFCKRLKKAIDILMCNLPFTLILRSPNFWYIAAALIKDRFPDQVKMINVIHGNESSIRYEIDRVKDDLEAIICSNSGIKRLFEEEICSIDGKLIAKNHPIIPLEKCVKQQKHKTICLGYAGRIERIDKRSDFILDFITELEKYKLEYKFFIAGEGAFEDELKKFIFENRYTEKIKMLGKLPYDQMHDFWERTDVFLNFSDTEGFCLSMIEALQMGTACVTTRVHEDIELFVKDNVNGYVVEKGDMKLMAERVASLIIDPSKIQEFEKNSLEIIRNMDDGREYIQMLMEL